MKKTRKMMIMEGYWYNNKREDCMIRKEDTIYFDKLSVLLLLLLSFLLLIFIVSVFVTCPSLPIVFLPSPLY